MVRSTLTFIPFIWLHHQSFEMGDRWSIQFPRQPCHDDCSCHVMWGIATLKDSQSSWQPCWGRWTKGRKYPEVAWIHSVSLSLPVLILPDQLCTVVLRTSQWLIYLDRLLKTISVSRYGCFWTHTKKTEYNTPHRPPCCSSGDDTEPYGAHSSSTFYKWKIDTRLHQIIKDILYIFVFQKACVSLSIIHKSHLGLVTGSYIIIKTRLSKSFRFTGRTQHS